MIFDRVIKKLPNIIYTHTHTHIHLHCMEWMCIWRMNVGIRSMKVRKQVREWS